jgi:TolA-binding protein
MDPTVLVAIVGAAGIVFAGILTLLGVRFTQRQAREAAAATARLERTKVDAAAYDRARATWDEHVDSLREQVADLREEAESARLALRDARIRIDGLEEGRDADRARIRQLTGYARDLLRIMADHEITYPAPPVGLG